MKVKEIRIWMNIWNLNNGLEYQIEIISGISRFEN